VISEKANAAMNQAIVSDDLVITNNNRIAQASWSTAHSRELYNIERWGKGYFDINESGHLVVRPRCDTSAQIDLVDVINDLKRLGLGLPTLLRFNDIVRNQVDELCNAFEIAMETKHYEGGYVAVYPIKVNQQRSVVHTIQSHGGHRVGLEAGSKAELIVVMGLSNCEQRNVVVCNGYKDPDYIRLALIGCQLGLNIFIVIEKLSEVETIVAESRRMGVKPQLGMRVRLASLANGKWQDTGGDKSKFGLSAVQVLAAVEALRHAGLLDGLTMLHAHMGSQIANVRDIHQGITELARYYAELRNLGAPIETVDVGGGLGVDYEGAYSRSFCSMNYSIQEYANTVVHALWKICMDNELPHPAIFSESGRAMVAHHAVLVTNVIDHEQAPGNLELTPPDSTEPLILSDMWQVYESSLPRISPVEAYHEASHWFMEAQSMYSHGVLNMHQRARLEQLYFAICRRIQQHLNGSARSHREVLDELKEKLADKYFCNFSLFQSLPDVWAIDQLFPIVPLHRLAEQPSRRGILQDLTCDSDGRIDLYVGANGVESTLALHLLHKNEPYLLGIFLVGAYQEILGDMHNMFGDTHSANIELKPGGGYRIVEPTIGDKVHNLLNYVNFDPDELIKAFSAKVSATQLPNDQRRSFLAELKAALSEYTYLSN
jgi:arginine decarboxylase